MSRATDRAVTMDEPTTDREHEAHLDAGDFAAWVDAMQAALRRERDADVPCAGCTACCRASQFIVIEPHEHATLARIPREVVFPAPRLPAGYMVLAYDARGHCAMLRDDGCSIYADRPQACRTYDCRLLAAAHVADDDAPKADLMARVQRWRFRYGSARARALHDAVLAATAYLRAHRDELRRFGAPTLDAHLAVLAVEVHEVFLDGDQLVDPGFEAVAAAVRAAIAASARLSQPDADPA